MPAALREAVKIIKSRFGANVESYLPQRKPAPQFVSALTRRSSEFNIAARAAPITIHEETAIDCGGYWTNNLNSVAAVDVSRSPSLVDALRGQIDSTLQPECVNASFVSRRYLDVSASKRDGRPTLSYSEAVVALVRNKPERATTATLCLIDRVGVTPLHTANPTRVANQFSGARELDKIVPPRTQLLNAYPDRLVLESEGSRAYWIFEQSASTLDSSAAVGGIRGVTFSALRGGRIVRPRSPRRSSGEWSPNTNNDLLVPVQRQPDIPVIDGDAGGGGGTGGPGGVVILEDHGCVDRGYTTRDACLGCCDNNRNTALSVISGGLIGALFACAGTTIGYPICVAIATAAAAVATGTVMIISEACVSGCNIHYPG